MSTAAKSRPLPQSKGSTPAASNGSKPANAWARPLQPTKPAPPPGMAGSPAKAGNDAATAPPPLVLRERFLHLTLSMVGQKVVVTRTNGAVLEGILHTFTPFSSQPKERRNVYVLKACKSITPSDDDDVVPMGSTLFLPSDQVLTVLVKSMRLDTSSNAGTPNPSSHGKANDPFRTDTEISHPTQEGKRRELVMADSSWTSPGANSRAAGLLGEDNKGGRKGFNAAAGGGGGLRGDIGQWDQFKANEDLFQVSAGFDENIYTTALDKSGMDHQKVKEAERLAREIETTVSSNVHIAEERGQAVAVDYDEEDRYSGVLQKQPAESASKKTMNYAAAAAKADTTKTGAAVPPGFGGAKASEEEETRRGKVVDSPLKSSDKTKEEVEGSTDSKSNKAAKGGAKVPAARVTPEVSKVPRDKEVGQKEQIETAPVAKDGGTEKKEGESAKASTKLNANAKSFSFNPTARSFTPGGGAAPAQPEPPVADPNTGMPVGQPPMPHYVQHPAMGQPGMVQMMGGPYVRYQGPYPGMEHHMGMPPQQQPQHIPPPPPQQHEGTGSQSSGDEQQQQQALDGPPPAPQQPQQVVSVPYGPQGSYYPGMMPPRGPNGPPMYPQQQIQYRQVYGGPMPVPGSMPNMTQMRGNPYYQGPPMGGMHYPSAGGYPGHGGGMVDEDYRGGRGGRGGRSYGRGGRRNSYRGRGRGGYHQNGGGNERQTAQSGGDTNDIVDERAPTSTATTSNPTLPMTDGQGETKPSRAE